MKNRSKEYFWRQKLDRIMERTKGVRREIIGKVVEEGIYLDGYNYFRDVITGDTFKFPFIDLMNKCEWPYYIGKRKRRGYWHFGKGEFLPPPRPLTERYGKRVNDDLSLMRYVARRAKRPKLHKFLSALRPIDRLKCLPSLAKNYGSEVFYGPEALEVILGLAKKRKNL